MIIKDDLYNKLEKLGYDEVNLRLKSQLFTKQEKPLVEDWLLHKDKIKESEEKEKDEFHKNISLFINKHKLILAFVAVILSLLMISIAVIEHM